MIHRHRPEAKRLVLVTVLSILMVALSGGAIRDRGLASRVQAAPPVPQTPAIDGRHKIAPQVRQAMESLHGNQTLTVIVTLTEQADLSAISEDNWAARLRRVIEARQSTAELTQAAIRDLVETRRLEQKVDGVSYFWVLNGLAVSATPQVIEEIAAQPEVFTITANEIIQAPSSPWGSSQIVPSATELNLSVTNAPALWDLGFRGQGVVVANMDTGVDINHPALSSQWRGGTNSWFDPYGEHPTTPTDVKGHGTWTMGVMVGQDPSGSAVGIAPDAQWIAAKIFDDQGIATVEAIHKAFQWLLDPDGDPNTADAPHVVNNSWGYQYPGCNLEFQLDLQTLRAAGILPVFAAGNTGPNSSTSISPANYPKAFAVGATNNSDLVYSDSARGVSACGEAPTTFPEIVAPGVSIRTTDLFGTYTYVSGTSMAAPHVAGVLALLLSAYPGLSVADQEAALINGTVDLGTAGADNDYGYGRLNALATYQSRTPCPAFAAPPTVDLQEIQAVAAYWHKQSTDPGWDPRFDLTGDGIVTTADIMLAVARLGQPCL